MEMEENELTEKEREDLEDSLSDSTNLLTGEGCTQGMGYAPTIARYCTRADLKAINAYFDACDKAWKQYLEPIIDRCVAAEVKERREEQERRYNALTPAEKEELHRQYEREQQQDREIQALGDAIANGTHVIPDSPPYVPVATCSQAQIQIQRTVPEMVTLSQADWLINRFHYRPDVVAKMTKAEAAAKLDELWKRENGG